MSAPELSSNPPPPPPPPPPSDQTAGFRSSRYADLDTHELIRLLDSIDDERAKARFRESVYISMFVWIAIAWFLFYGPQVIFRRPRLIDPSVALRKQHEAEMVQLSLPPALRQLAKPKPAAKTPTLDSKLLEKLRAAAPTPAPAPTPPPTPPNPQPSILPPVQPAPTPQPPKAPELAAIPDAPAPSPKLQLNTSSPGNLVRDASGAIARGGYNSLPTGPTHLPKTPGLSAGATIVSDTQGVDFSDYMRRLHVIIEQHWLPLLPQSVQPPISEHGVTGIDFKILPNGDIGGVTILYASGSRALDRAAFGSITSTGKLPPLPKEFHGPLLELHCGYYVNQEPPE